MIMVITAVFKIIATNEVFVTACFACGDYIFQTLVIIAGQALFISITSLINESSTGLVILLLKSVRSRRPSHSSSG
jgi:hypothetical protein